MPRFQKAAGRCKAAARAYLFRSGAANDESDGLARYSEQKLAVGKLGGTARSSRPMLGGELIFLAPLSRRGKLGGTARKEKLVPRRRLLLFYIKE